MIKFYSNLKEKFNIYFRKFKLYYKFILLFFLWFLLYRYPSGWIQFGLLPAIVEMLFYYMILNLGLSIIKIILVSVYKKRNKFSSDYYDNFILGIENVSFLLTNIIFIFILLYLLGVDLVVFMTSISIFSVALVLIFKEYIENMINGLILMFSKDFKLKEYIKIGEHKGRVRDITFLNTEIRTDDGDIIFIPNKMMLTKEIINYSKSNVKRIRFDFSLNSSFYGKVHKLEKYISKKLSSKFEKLVDSESILIKAVEIKKDEALFIIEILVSRYNFKVENEIKKYIAKQVLKFMDRETKKDLKKNSSKSI